MERRKKIEGIMGNCSKSFIIFTWSKDVSNEQRDSCIGISYKHVEFFGRL
jgi:hypothetical protein